MLLDIPESWHKAAAEHAAALPPLSDEQRRGLTNVAVQYARKRLTDALDRLNSRAA